MKKKNEKLAYNNDVGQMNEANKTAKSQMGGLRINTTGLSLASNIKACNEGMSPLMERFQRNKKGNNSKQLGQKSS